MCGGNVDQWGGVKDINFVNNILIFFVSRWIKKVKYYPILFRNFLKK